MGVVQTFPRSALSNSSDSTLPSADISLTGGAEVLDFQSFRARKELNGNRKTGLSETFNLGTDSTEASSSRPNVDLATRIERIKSSISRINALMTELRSSSESPKG